MIKPVRRPRKLGLRARLLLGLAAALLLISLLTLLFYRVAGQLALDLRQIENTHLELTTAALRAREDMMHARRYEKDFLLVWRELGYDQARVRYQSLVLQELNEIREIMQKISLLSAHARAANAMPDFVQIERQLERYQAGFLELVQLHGRLGRHNSGLEGQFRQRIDQIEQRLPAAATALQNQLLELRLAEKEYLLRGQPRYAMAVQYATQQLTSRIRLQPGMEPAEAGALAALLSDYEALFQQYVQNAEKIELVRSELSAAANILEPLLEAWYQRAEAANHSQFLQGITTTLRAAQWFSAGGAMAFLLMLLSAWLLWHGLARAIERTVAFAARIAAGDLSARLAPAEAAAPADPAAGDEIDRLDHALNRMADALEQAQHSLMQHAHQLELSSRGKDEFLAAISHELRTPLNQILGFADLLKEGLAGPLSEAQKSMMQDIFDAGHKQLAMINNLIELARLQAGKIALQTELQDPAALLQEIGARYSARAPAAGLRFTLELADDLPQMPLDTGVLNQLLQHLLANVFKFTPADGQVRLLARCVPSTTLPQPLPGDATRYLELAIIDNGPGLTTEGLQRLSQAFEQDQASLTRSHEGMGLGLAMARLLAELHGGSIAIKSAPSAGCTLLLWLPVDATASGKEM